MIRAPDLGMAWGPSRSKGRMGRPATHLTNTPLANSKLITSALGHWLLALGMTVNFLPMALKRFWKTPATFGTPKRRISRQVIATSGAFIVIRRLSHRTLERTATFDAFSPQVPTFAEKRPRNDELNTKPKNIDKHDGQVSRATNNARSGRRLAIGTWDRHCA